MAPTTLDSNDLETSYYGADFSYSAPGYYTPDFEDRVNRELNRLAALPENWDLERAKPIDPVIIEAAKNFIAKLPKYIATIPSVVPSAAGNLQFEWSKGPRTLEIEIETPNTIHYLKWHPEEGIEEEDVFDINNIVRAVSLIQWFMRGVGYA
jgi:hypothetical protein